MTLAELPRPTATYHTKPYPSIAPSRPELSLKGKTVLITGGATGIGLETTKAFAEAGASIIALLARSEKPMIEAKAAVEGRFPATKILVFAASINDHARVESVVKEIGTIDVLVLNAGVMPAPAGILETDTDQLLDAFQTNVIGPWNLMKAFVALTPRDPKEERTIIYTSSGGIHLPMPRVAGYNATKAAATHITSSVAREYGDKGIRAFAFHPVVAFTPMARDVMGLKEDSFPYDSPELGAHFAVWLSSSEADFLKGRFLWSNWDVDELKAKKELIESDPTQLTIGLTLDKVVAPAP